MHQVLFQIGKREEAMKKKKLTCVFLVICIFCFPIMLFSADAIDEDSITFDATVFEKIDNASRSNTIKIYNGLFLQYFAKRIPIDEIIRDENLLDPYYVVKSGLKNAEYFYIRNNQAQPIKVNPPKLDKTLVFVTSPERILNSVSSHLSVQKVYYLNSDSSYNGIYLYYVTTQGDYIYYQEHAADDNGYLFTLEEFYDISLAAYEKIKADNTGNVWELPAGGPTFLSDVVDISAYRITPQTPIALYVGIAVALVACGAVALIFIRRRRTKNTV